MPARRPSTPKPTKRADAKPTPSVAPLAAPPAGENTPHQSNAQIAAALGLIAQLLEILGEDKFRVISHQKAARIVEGLTTDLDGLARQGKPGRDALLTIDGVGPRIADKIIELVTTGSMRELDDLRAKVPPGLPALLAISGMGPKTVAMVWKEAGVTDLDGLRRIIADGSMARLPRMGDKAVEKIKAGLDLLAQGAGRVHLGVALPLAEAIVERMTTVKGVARAAFAGSLRRGKETIGDIDILVTARSDDGRDAAVEAFCTLPGIRRVLSRGPTRCSVQMTIPPEGSRFGDASGDAGTAATVGPTIQVDLRLLPEHSWGAGLMYFTGSKEHNVRLRERALKMGLTLNDYGLFPDDGKPAPQDRGLKPVASRTEEEIFAALKLPFIPPELREDRGETALDDTPPLIEIGDLRADLHTHTTASDGTLSIIEMGREALRRGLSALAITDHSKSSAIANGLSPERLREHVKAIHAARRDPSLKGLTLLAGSEVDILSDGSLDYDDDLLAKLDVVVASPHASLSQKPDIATARLVRALRHPRVHILGHPTGRLILRRAGLSPDMSAIFEAAREGGFARGGKGVALEINAHYLRLDLRDTHVKAALDAGCLIAINTDAHGSADFDNLRFGVLTGRRGWLPPERCINTWPTPRLLDWLA